MTEKKEKVEKKVKEDLKVTEASAENTKSAEVVTESAGEMVAEEKPILKAKKEKKVRASQPIVAAGTAAGTSPEEFDWDAY
jgi:hypothetical protein